MIKEYPAVVYKDEGAHPRHGGTYDLKLIMDDSELVDAIEAGWHETLPDAIAKKSSHVEPVVKSALVKGKVKPHSNSTLNQGSGWGG